jgi:hypothetical protein
MAVARVAVAAAGSPACTEAPLLARTTLLATRNSHDRFMPASALSELALALVRSADCAKLAAFS